MSPRRDRDDRGRVRIPADVERPDKLLAGLTARQLAILGTTAVVLWAGYATTRHLVPAAVYGVAAVPIGAAAAFLALGRFEGVAADRWLSFAWRHHRAPRRLVPAPDGIPAPPAHLNADVIGVDPGPQPAPLRLPVNGVDSDGLVDLGPDGWAVVCRASAVTFSLRTPSEQEALVAGFARWLNALDQPAQILVRAEPVDLRPAIDALLDAAPGLPHPALEAAARDHAAFLADLGRRRDLLRREVLVVLRQPAGNNPSTTAARSAAGDGAARLLRRASEAAAALAAAGVTLVALDAAEAARGLTRALDPAGEPRLGSSTGGLGVTDAPITLAKPPSPRRKADPR